MLQYTTISMILIQLTICFPTDPIKSRELDFKHKSPVYNKASTKVLSRRQIQTNLNNEDIKKEIQDIIKLMNILKQFDKFEKEIYNSTNGNILINSDPQFVSLDNRLASNNINLDNTIIKNNNNVNRQEEILISSTSLPSISASTDFSNSATEEFSQPSFSDLEDSFGGLPETAVRATLIDSNSPTRKTGLYYLVDWNTIFDVDDQKGNRVNLRFQPTIGDPKQFLSVTVP